MSLGRLVEAISLVERVKSVFSAVNCQIFWVKMSKNHTLLIFLRGTVVLPYSGVSVRHLVVTSCYTVTLASVAYVSVVDLPSMSASAVRLLYCPRNPLTLGYSSLLPFNLPFFYVPGFARTTCAQSRGTRMTHLTVCMYTIN